MVAVLFGVAGAGKTYVGEMLAAQLGWTFIDADDLHPPSNIAKMKAGLPLSDADRAPWLGAVRETIARSGNAVVACSALKREYRAQLCISEEVRFVFLRVNFATAHQRTGERRDHFFPPALLETQFRDLEEPTPDEAVIVDAEQSPVLQLQHIRAALGFA